MNLAILSRKLGLFRSCLLLAALLLIYSSAAHSQSAQSPPPADAPRQATISVQSDLVAIPVRVTDAHSNFVPGLRQQDFQVYEEGRPQSITLFQQEDAPVTVGLVVDHSRSMGKNLAEVTAAVYAFSHSTNPQDEMFVVDFNDDVWLQMLGGKLFTHDAGDLEKAIAAVGARGRTALYDAIAEGINHMRYGHWEKKALILVTDGGDNASHQKFSDILALAQRSQVMIYSIVLLNTDEEENPGILRRLCKSTGGIAYFPDAKQSVASITNQIARDLREQYTIGFAPQKQGSAASFRKIQVKVSATGQGKLNVRSRPGYFAPDEKKVSAQSGKGAS
ncbi:MAG TPA: VWA domain-containing protein [Candidatus Acidoferrum sp.]|nr:VWA domain-containing protein [Candidatus Acidoferrum sp.]